MKIQIERAIVKEYGFKEVISWAMAVDGRYTLSLGRGEPEDMIIGRDLFDASSVLELLEFAYEMGKQGSSFEVVETEYERHPW